MGSSPEPAFTNIFLGFHEIIWFEKCTSEFRPVIYKRYVDDTFLLFQNINQIEKFKNYHNLQHANIKFISEIEMNYSLYFLDINIVRENNKLTTSVYRRLIFSGEFTYFRRVTRGTRGGGLPCPFSKFKEKCPDFGRKCPN